MGGEAKRILVIEDNPAFRKIMKIRLEASGYKILIAEDGLIGLNMARNEVPDMIITDLMMPQMDGHKVCRMLKYDTKYMHIPVIILTSRDLEKDADIAKSCRADAFILKTTKAQIVLDVIEQLLLRSSKVTVTDHTAMK